MKWICCISLILCAFVYACADKQTGNDEIISEKTDCLELKKAFSDFHGNLKIEDFDIISIDTINTQNGAFYECMYSTVDDIKGEFIVSTIPIGTEGVMAVVICEFEGKYFLAMPMNEDGFMDCEVDNNVCIISVCDTLVNDNTLKVGTNVTLKL